MIVEVRIPEVGESITDGVLAAWLVEDGAGVQAGEDLFELETDKVTMAVPADVPGRVSQQVPEGAVVQVGQVVASIDTDAAQLPAPSDPAVPEMERQQPAEQASPAEPVDQVPSLSPKAGNDQAKAALAANPPPLSPAVRRLVEQKGLDPAGIAGTGKGGRITKEDLVTHLEQGAQASPSGKQLAARPVEPAPVLRSSPDRQRETRVKMSKLRQRITERLVQVQQEAAILTTFNECDMSKVMEFRTRFKDRFEKRFDVRLGFMSFFVKAAVDALKTVPQLNARIEGDEIVYQNYYDIGVAVGTEQGLVVPVIRDADQLSFARIEETVSDLAKRARLRKLTLPDLTGGCFTISNGGVYGSLQSTPILNPPQSGILGLHRIQKRPVVIDDQIVARPMMYLALSYDHRVVDGSEAVTFLKRIVECIEDPERMLLEV